MLLSRHSLCAIPPQLYSFTSVSIIVLLPVLPEVSHPKYVRSTNLLVNLLMYSMWDRFQDTGSDWSKDRHITPPSHPIPKSSSGFSCTTVRSTWHFNTVIFFKNDKFEGTIWVEEGLRKASAYLIAFVNAIKCFPMSDFNGIVFDTRQTSKSRRRLGKGKRASVDEDWDLSERIELRRLPPPASWSQRCCNTLLFQLEEPVVSELVIVTCITIGRAVGAP